MTQQIVALKRDCRVTEIPSGSLHVLSEGTPVVITQTLGGSYTVTVGYGQLMRVDAKDADALGFEPAQQPESASEFSEKAVWDQLKTVYDPEIPVNIVDLGLVYSCAIAEQDGGHKIDITMSMTAPGCGMGDVLKSDIEQKLSALPTVNQVHVEVVFDPPWSPRMMSEATRLQLGLDY
ncbi:MAG TPA: putative Fe-S cluster assembly protein SufT [Candidatus Angelobacter sp.]|nr:putative Fe-S cluster assembly protein SufT [Candidatus Angelobacter sp.]